MKNLTNIDIFNGVAVRVFALLYENFPSYVPVDYNTLSLDLVDKDDYDGAWDIPELAESSVQWLADAGYIWLKRPEYYGDSYKGVLSPKGLEILNSVPTSVDKTSDKTLGKKMIDVSKEKLNVAVNTLIEIVISQGARIMFPGMSS